MERKFVIFLVFASLAQISYISATEFYFGLSDDKADTFDNLLANQNVTRIAFSNGLNAIFDMFLDSITGTENCSSNAAEALAEMCAANDAFLDSITLIAEEAYSDTEAARNTTCNYLDDAIEQIVAALELAQYGNYSENKDAIAVYQDTVQEDFTNVLEDIYELIYTYLNITEDDTLDVVQSTQNKSNVGITYTANAIFNAIALLSASNTDVYKDKIDLHNDIEELRGKALAGLKDDYESRYILLQTLLIDSNLNQSGIVSVSAAIQHALTISYNRYVEGNVVLFNTLRRFLLRAYLGLSDDGEVDFPRNEVDLRDVIALFDVGDRVLLDSFLTLHPDASSVVAKTRETIHTLNVAGDVAFYDAIALATAVGANYTEILEKIEADRHAAVDPAPQYTDIFYNVIRNNITFDEEIEAELVSLQNITTYGAQVSTNKFLDGVEILVNATYTGEVSEDTFAAIDTLLDEAIEGLKFFCQGMTAAAFVVLQVITAS